MLNYQLTRSSGHSTELWPRSFSLQ